MKRVSKHRMKRVPTRPETGRKGKGGEGEGEGEGKKHYPQPMASPSSAPKGAERAHRLPDDWRPSEARRAEAAKLGLLSETLDVIAEEFRNYWLSEGGPKARKLDWDRTFLNRLRDQAHRRTNHRVNPAAHKTNTRMDAIIESENDADNGAAIHIAGM